MMSDMEEVAAAEEKMDAARQALLSYVGSQKTVERDQHRKLVARVKRIETEFMRVLRELGK